ncbi:MAG: ArnT family glycosyltransferase [Candidatus Kapaibacterium sp.]
MTERQHTTAAVILVIMGLYLMRLSAVEIQPSPEGDIALRGEAIVSSQQLMDVSSHSIGGLSTSSTPPLPSWLVAAGISMFGPTAIAVRLGALVAVCGLLILTFLVAKRVVPYAQALLATAVVGLSMPMITVGRQMTPEVIATALVMLAWWSVLRLLTAKTTSERIVPMVTYAVGLAGALLTHLPLSVVALVMIVPAILRRETLQWSVGGILLGLALGLPWYAVMISHHGSDFFLALSALASSSGAMSGGFSSGPLDVVALLVLSSPVLAAALLWVLMGIRHRDILPERSDVVLMTAGLWFVGMMIVVALSRHHTMSAMLPIIPAASIVSFAMLQTAMRRSAQDMMLTVLAGMALASIAALLVHLRLVRSGVMVLGVVGLAGMFVLLLVATSAARRQRLAVRLTKPLINAAIGVTGLAAIATILLGTPSTISGGRTVGLRMLEDTSVARSFVYLYHRNAPTDNVNSQLAWYTRGWMSGRNPRYSYQPLAMPAEVIDASVVRAGIGAPWIVYYHPGIAKDVRSEIFELLDADYSVAEESGEWVLFEKKLRLRLK